MSMKIGTKMRQERLTTTYKILYRWTEQSSIAIGTDGGRKPGRYYSNITNLLLSPQSIQKDPSKMCVKENWRRRKLKIKSYRLEVVSLLLVKGVTQMLPPLFCRFCQHQFTFAKDVLVADFSWEIRNKF